MKNRVKKLFIIITLLATLSSPYSAFADSSASSNLSQVITDCARDSLETGSQMNEPICPTFPSKFSKFDLVNGKTCWYMAFMTRSIRWLILIQVSTI